MGTTLHEVDYKKFNALATNSLVKSTWEFLHSNNIILNHDITVRKNTTNDQVLMPILCQGDLSTHELEAINQCRLYLQAYHISDIATASGKLLSAHAWEGTARQDGTTTTYKWPYQGPPSRGAWNIWRQALQKTVLSRGRRLKHNIGIWLRQDLEIWKWYFSPQLDGLVHLESVRNYTFFKRPTPIKNQNIFSATGTPIVTLPNDLQKASVKKTRQNRWWLVDTSQILADTSSTVPSIRQQPIDETFLNPWCFTHVILPSFYDPLITDIKNGDTWLVSDGSYDPINKAGTAAWILEGKASNIQITGRVITPGEESMQSAYRSELAGILAALSVINTLAAFHDITATITLFCDSSTGIEKAFQDYKPTIRDASYDLLQAIYHERNNSTILWRGQHVKGHQDDNMSFEQLPRPSQLNILADHMAKAFLPTAIKSPRHYLVNTHAWSIRIGSIPIIQNMDDILYNLVHTPTAKAYWIKRSRLTETSFSSVNWPSLGKALSKMPLSKRLFVSKHTSGMCGVGKFQKIWKTRETNSCPHCGEYEDSVHVWKCASSAVFDIWTHSLLKLQNSLRRLDTDPNLIEVIIKYLNAWRSDDTLHALNTHQYLELVVAQETIGARQFFEGWLHWNWEATQAQYYKEIHSRRSPQRWTTAVITKLWDVAWDLWEYRNSVFHQHMNRSLQEDVLTIDLQIKDIHSAAETIPLLPKDRHLMTISINRLLDFPRHRKVEWMQHTLLAMQQAKKSYFNLRQTRQEYTRRHHDMIVSMQTTLRTWLQSSSRRHIGP
jgi:hypothetical protein